MLLMPLNSIIFLTNFRFRISFYAYGVNNDRYSTVTHQSQFDTFASRFVSIAKYFDKRLSLEDTRLLLQSAVFSVIENPNPPAFQ